MIIDAILLVFQGFLNVLLMPLTALNIGIDFISSIPVVTQFLQVVAYILPFSNILPLILLVISIYIFKITLAVFNFVIGVVGAVH